MMQPIKIWLSKNFSIKDLKEVSYILEIKIYRDISNIIIGFSQSRCIDTVLKRFNMEDSKWGYLPIIHDFYLFKKMPLKTSKQRWRTNGILLLL